MVLHIAAHTVFFPSTRSSWNISQIPVTCHRNSPPFFIRARLQQHRRRSFFYSASGLLSNTICLGSMECWCTVIPSWVFTGFAKFQRVVCINDFGLFRETSVNSFPSTEKFCFARIRLDPLSCQVLCDDSVSMIVSRFTSFIKNLVICCYQVTEVFCRRYCIASTKEPLSYWSQAYFAISVFFLLPLW